MRIDNLETMARKVAETVRPQANDPSMATGREGDGRK